MHFTQNGIAMCTVDLLWLRSRTVGSSERTTWHEPGRPADSLAPITAWNDGFFGGAVEVRAGGFNGVAARDAHVRLVSPVASGRADLPAAAAVGAADNAHGIGALINHWPPDHLFVNPDLTVALARDPRAAWMSVHVEETWPGDQTGLALATIADSDGVFGHITQTQIVSANGNNPS